MSKILTDNQLNQVKDFISLEMLKRGYTAKIVKFEEIRKTDTTSRIEFHTESFQTTPVLFKELNISNFSSQVEKDLELSKKYEEEVYSLWIQVSVRYENFSGGTNGINLFSIRGSFVKRDRRVEDLIAW